MLSPNFKFKLNLHKAYFDKGYAMTSLAKNIMFLVGGGAILSGVNYFYVAYLGVVYGIFCYLLGWAWYKFGWYEQEIEVSNQFNIFVQETRRFINGRKHKKSWQTKQPK